MTFGRHITKKLYDYVLYGTYALRLYTGIQVLCNTLTKGSERKSAHISPFWLHQSLPVHTCDVSFAQE